jgi:hypothetical protein
MAEWGQVSSIVALAMIPFTVWGTLHTLVPFLAHQYRKLLLKLKPKVRCDRLLWRDVLEGELHECAVHDCDHTLSHKAESVKCWEGQLPVVYSRGWQSQSKRNAENYLPETLHEKGEFLEIDFRVLLGFIISTIGCSENVRLVHSGFSVYRGSGQFEFDVRGLQRIQLKFHENYVVAHVQGLRCRPWSPTGDKSVRPWTKAEIENLLKGYPPFYSARITLHDGQTKVDFPIYSQDDIHKGGWVLAVQLGKITNPLPLYFESQPATEESHRKPTFQKATEWVRDMLREPFIRSFTDDHNVIAASKALDALCSGQRYISSFLEGSDLSEEASHSLGEADSVKAMEIFTRPTLMTVLEREQLKKDAQAILVPMLSAAVFGVREVLRFEKECVDFTSKLPPALRPSSRIFLRDCVKQPDYTTSELPTGGGGGAW